jgi:23S rRNA (pseudouridine1915-N3)-methyltransferase
MRIKLVSVGNKAPSWVQDGYQEYAKRLPRECPLELIEIPVAHRGKNPDTRRLIEQEGQAMLRHVDNADWVIAMDVRGKRWTTEQLAKEIERWQMESQQVVLLVGGPDGLSDDCLKRADQRWSLSELTFPHPLVRVILAETIYRSWSLSSGHPYHRG